ncbi:MAG: hypothetical protein KAY21_05965 [Limnohabitans sp.]|nr:hypothetical protein [Limnohabitans sp.]
MAIHIGKTFDLEWLAIMLMAGAMTRFLVTPILAPKVEHLNPIWGIRRIQGFELLVGLCMSACMWVGWQNPLHWVVFSVVYAAPQSIYMGFFSKAASNYLGQGQLTDHVAREAALMNLSRLGGPVLGGGLMLFLDASSILIWILSAGLVLNYVLGKFLLTIQTTHGAEATSFAGHQRTVGWHAWWREMSAGFVGRWKIPLERHLSILVFLELLLIIPSFGLMLPYLVLTRGLPSHYLGWLELASGLGMVGGALLAPRVLKRFPPLRAVTLSMLVMASGFGLFAWLFDQAPLIPLCLLLLGIMSGMAVRIQAGAAQRRLAIPERFRMRFAAVHATLNTLAAQLGLLFFGAVTQNWGLHVWLYICAGFFMLVPVWIIKLKDYVALLSLSEEQARDHYEKYLKDSS